MDVINGDHIENHFYLTDDPDTELIHMHVPIRDTETAAIAEAKEYGYGYVMKTYEVDQYNDVPDIVDIEPVWSRESNHTANESYPVKKRVGRRLRGHSLQEQADDNQTAPLGPQLGPDSGFATMLNALIQDEWEAIQGYNDLQSMIEDKQPPYSDEFLRVIADINAEENTHVGQLQRLMELIAPNAAEIKSGVREAEKEVGEANSDPAPLREKLTSNRDWQLVERREVHDDSGQLTDYSWYKRLTDVGECHIMMLGDPDQCPPDKRQADAVFDDRDHAEEWFDSYEDFQAT